ncbi:kinase-like domain-containing protein [Rhizophagus irregularis DAOM 181602=DAOM 197198]|nr:kinase-like domain-containing protein [Rhizophagus irregularis DAOM 181602=DAOM 197198]
MSYGGFSEIYTARWIEGSYEKWNSKAQKLRRIEEQIVVLKKLENVENANQNWFEEAKSHLNLSNKHNDITQCYDELLTQPEENNSFEIENHTSSNILSTSRLHHFENLPEPRNATEGELEAFYSKSFDFCIPDNIDDIGKSINKENSTSEISTRFKDVQNEDKRETIQQQINKYHDNVDDEDEVYNNPNFHSEEQDTFELPDNI